MPTCMALLALMEKYLNPSRLPVEYSRRCPGSHTFWEFLLLDAYLRFWYSLRWHQFAHQTWWQIIQLETATSKDQSHLCPHKRNVFADDAALVSHTQEGLQCLMDMLSKACKEFALTICIKKTEVMAQDAEISPSFYILHSILMVPTSLWLTISNN